mgnify:CR=1 FL=1
MTARIRDLAVRSTMPLLDGVCLDLEPSTVTVLLGPSGAGKSTLLRACLDLLPAGLQRVGGTFEWAGIDFFELDSKAQRARRGAELSWVPQEPLRAFHPMLRIETQVAEVVRAHRREPWACCRRWARQALEAWDFPMSRARQIPSRLSGGELRRAALAAAFVLDARWVLLDEPTTGLDAATAEHWVERFEKRVARGVGALLVTHDVDLARRVAHRVAYLCGGRLEETGEARLLKAPRTEGLRRFLGLAAQGPHTA